MQGETRANWSKPILTQGALFFLLCLDVFWKSKDTKSLSYSNRHSKTQVEATVYYHIWLSRQIWKTLSAFQCISLKAVTSCSAHLFGTVQAAVCFQVSPAETGSRLMGRISGDGVPSSGWTSMLSSSFRGVAGGSHLKSSFEEVKPELLDVLTSSVRKLNTDTHTYTHTLTSGSLWWWMDEGGLHWAWCSPSDPFSGWPSGARYTALSLSLSSASALP